MNASGRVMRKSMDFLVVGLSPSLTLLAFAAYGCSTQPSCEETRTCGTPATPESESSGGAAGAPASTGGGGTSVAPAAGGVSTAGGLPGAMPTSTPTDTGMGTDMGAPCDVPEGTLACSGSASETVLACRGGLWSVSETCEDGSLCDSSDPGCAEIAPGCERLAPGDSFCEENTRHTCGPDLVSLESEECAGRCAGGDCVAATCGDGQLQEGEECDDGNDDDTDACTSSCEEPRCGDGFAFARDEECDDGNSIDSDDCTNDCREARCGDSIVHDGVEECDDANDEDTDECLETCERARCGDGVVQEGVEQCDDRNDVDTDGCPTTCRKAICGDGFVWTGEEECDDENLEAGDGCDSECQAEPVQITVGTSHTCAVLSDGRLKCWGDNSRKQIVDSADAIVGDRFAELGESLPSLLDDVSSVAAGDLHTCALQLGKVKCWGDNTQGQLGPDGPPDRSDEPVVVPFDSPPISLCAGNTWNAAQLENGTVMTWGYSGANPDSSLEIIPVDKTPEAIECAGTTVCMRFKNSPIAACQGGWQDITGGLRYIDTREFGAGSVLPSDVIVDVSAGIYHGCMLRAGGTVECWGASWSGALMIEEQPPSSWSFPYDGVLIPPSLVGSTKPLQVVGGGHATCVVYVDGTVKCWGENSYGVLGQPELTMESWGYIGLDARTLGDNLPPIRLGARAKVRSLSTSGTHTCALLEDGRVKCWGNNQRGQLGIGSSEEFIGDEEGEMGDFLKAALID